MTFLVALGSVATADVYAYIKCDMGGTPHSSRSGPYATFAQCKAEVKAKCQSYCRCDCRGTERESESSTPGTDIGGSIGQAASDAGDLFSDSNKTRGFKISKRENRGGWPYGRPAVVLGLATLGFQVGLGDNDSLTEFGSLDESPSRSLLTLSGALLLRLRPKCVGGVEFTIMDFLDGADGNLERGLSLNGKHLAGIVRREFLQNSSKGDYFTMYVDASAGWTFLGGNHYLGATKKSR